MCPVPCALCPVPSAPVDALCLLLCCLSLLSALRSHLTVIRTPISHLPSSRSPHLHPHSPLSSLTILLWITIGAPGECAFDRPTPRMTEVPHVLLLARHLLLFHVDWQSSALVDGALLHFCCL
ncbi:hypothetical protein AB1Y20_011785 [Prymnesium parvum]|uniref:Secreted protein n=1 Tax=Prymnesium parvum TaxID=97485 RepID=A0AB34IKU8_PRYPA